MSDVSKHRFSIRYFGEGFESNDIHVSQMIVALTGVYDLFKEISELSDTNYKTEVRFNRSQSGSFEIVFDVVQTLSQKISAYLFPALATASAQELVDNIIELVRYIKFLKGRAPTSEKQLDNGNIEIHVGSDSIVVPSLAYKASQSASVRKSVHMALGPCQFQSNYHAEIKSENNNSEIVSPVDIDPPAEIIATQQEFLNTAQHETVLTMVSVNFKDGAKWRFDDGGSVFSATISDESFIRKINSGDESFSKTDQLVCILKSSQIRESDGRLKKLYEIVEVLRHIKSPKQLALPGA